MTQPQPQSLRQLADWLRCAHGAVVLTGAGMSTESGVPDFRSKSGWWRNLDPQTVATVDALKGNYDLFHEFYATRIKGLDTVRPHYGHRVLADWEERGLLRAVATQNVDGLHQQAGNRRVSELHGSIRSVRCQNCDAAGEMTAFLAKEACPLCGGKLRPNVVLFGEMLPEGAWQQALFAIRQADLVLVIGTSLQVYPVNQLPTMTQGRVAIINYEPTDMDASFDLVIHGRAGDVLRDVEGCLTE